MALVSSFGLLLVVDDKCILVAYVMHITEENKVKVRAGFSGC